MWKPASLACSLSLAATAVCPAVDSRHSYLSEHEIQGFGDFDGDGLLDVVVVDRASGNYRVGRQVGGALSWEKPCPSGVAGVDGIAVGRVTVTGRDQLLVAGLLANRVHLLQPCAQPASPTMLAIEGVGPADVVAVDIAFPGNDSARHDLIVTSAFHGGGDSFQEILRGEVSGVSALTATELPEPYRRGSRVFPAENVEPWAGFMVLDDTAGSERFVVGNTQNPAVEDIRELPGFAVGTDYLAAPLMGGPANQVVFWLPGDPVLWVSEWTAVPELDAAVPHDLGAAIESVYVVEEPSGLALFVTFDGGAHGAVFALDGSGVPVAGQRFTAPTGERINGVLGFAPGALSMLIGPAGGGASTRFQQLDHDGARWRPVAGGALPSVGAASAGTNVFLYDGEPFVDPEAKLVQSLQVADWTSALVVSGGANPTATVVAETFGGQSAGLGGAAPQALGAVEGGVAFGLPSVLFGEASLSAEGGPLGLTLPSVSIHPPPGEYDRHVAAALVTDAARSYYRLGGNPIWVEFEAGDPDRPITSPFRGLEPFTVYYYAESDSGARSPIHRADYSFAGEPGTIDSDDDGVPDYVEIGYGLDPTAGADSDADGYPDLNELLAGSDPNDPDSVPAPGGEPIELGNLFDLALKPLSHDGQPGGGAVNASWAASNADHTPTNLHIYSMGQALIGHAPTEINDADNLADSSVRAPTSRACRPRAPTCSSSPAPTRISTPNRTTTPPRGANWSN